MNSWYVRSSEYPQNMALTASSYHIFTTLYQLRQILILLLFCISPCKEFNSHGGIQTKSQLFSYEFGELITGHGLSRRKIANTFCKKISNVNKWFHYLLHNIFWINFYHSDNHRFNCKKWNILFYFQYRWWDLK